MKKILISVAALSLVVVMGVMLAACSTNPVGKYELYSITVDGDTKKDGEIFDLTKEAYKDFELTEDNKIKIRGAEVGEWKQDGKKVTLTVMGEEDVEATISGSKLTFKDGDNKLVLKKVK